jgi:hypothetical protein
MQQTAVTYQLITHRQQNVILVQFAHNNAILARLKQIANPKFSKTHKS